MEKWRYGPVKIFFKVVLLLVVVVAAGELLMAEDIPLRNVDGLYKAPVRLNDSVTLDFAIDTGAADVSMSDEVVDALTKSGAIDKADIKGSQTYVLADGSKIKCRALIIRKMQLGKQEAKDVEGSTCPGKALLLLGQSFFKKLGSWSMDLNKNLMIVKSEVGEVAIAPKPMPVPEPTLTPEPKPASSSPKTKPPKASAAAATTCDFDVAKILNGATREDSNTIWSCKVGKEPYYVAPLQLFADGTGIGYAAGSGKFNWRKTGCRSFSYNFSASNQTFEATDLYGDLNYGTFTMTIHPNDSGQQNVVCVKQEGRVSEQAVTQVQVVSPGKIGPTCKLLQKSEMRDDLISIMNTAAGKGATHVAYGDKKGAGVLIAMYQCEVSGKESTSLGAHAQSMGDVAKAEELYNKALAANPNDAEALNGLGIIHSQKGDLAKGGEFLEKALAINPNNAQVLSNLGLLYDAKGELAGAQEMFDKALAIDPNHVGALDGLGVLYAKKGDLNKARALLEKALTINPDSGRTLYNLARVYELQFDTAKAIELYKKFLNSSPNVPVEALNQVRTHILELEKR